MAAGGAPVVKVYYGKPMLPDVSRVLACLYEKEIDFKLIDMNEGRQTPHDFMKLQASTRLPVPGFDDGSTTLFESRSICRYVVEKYEDRGNRYLLGRDLLERTSIEQLLKSEEQSFDPPSWALVFHLAFALPDPDRGLVAEDERRLAKVLDVYDQRLAGTRFLAGNEFSLADLSHLPNSHYLANSREWAHLFESRRNVSRWWSKISNRPSWKEAVKVLNDVGILKAPSGADAAAAKSPPILLSPFRKPTAPSSTIDNQTTIQQTTTSSRSSSPAHLMNQPEQQPAATSASQQTPSSSTPPADVESQPTTEEAIDDGLVNVQKVEAFLAKHRPQPASTVVHRFPTSSSTVQPATPVTKWSEQPEPELGSPPSNPQPTTPSTGLSPPMAPQSVPGATSPRPDPVTRQDKEVPRAAPPAAQPTPQQAATLDAQSRPRRDQVDRANVQPGLTTPSTTQKDSAVTPNDELRSTAKGASASTAAQLSPRPLSTAAQSTLKPDEELRADQPVSSDTKPATTIPSTIASTGSRYTTQLDQNAVSNIPNIQAKSGPTPLDTAQPATSNTTTALSGTQAGTKPGLPAASSTQISSALSTSPTSAVQSSSDQLSLSRNVQSDLAAPSIDQRNTLSSSGLSQLNAQPASPGIQSIQQPDQPATSNTKVSSSATQSAPQLTFQSMQETALSIDQQKTQTRSELAQLNAKPATPDTQSIQQPDKSATLGTQSIQQPDQPATSNTNVAPSATQPTPQSALQSMQADLTAPLIYQQKTQTSSEFAQLNAQPATPGIESIQQPDQPATLNTEAAPSATQSIPQSALPSRQANLPAPSTDKPASAAPPSALTDNNQSKSGLTMPNSPPQLGLNGPTKAQLDSQPEPSSVSPTTQSIRQSDSLIVKEELTAKTKSNSDFTTSNAEPAPAATQSAPQPGYTPSPVDKKPASASPAATPETTADMESQPASSSVKASAPPTSQLASAAGSPVLSPPLNDQPTPTDSLSTAPPADLNNVRPPPEVAPMEQSRPKPVLSEEPAPQSDQPPRKKNLDTQTDRASESGNEQGPPSRSTS